MSGGCYCNSCPEAVQTINVAQYTVAIDGVVSNWADEYYTTASPEYSAAASPRITLPNTPVSAESVTLFLNSGAQQQDAAPNDNFSISSNVMLLGFTPDAADTLHVRYFYVA